jgi:hypothetical protein
MILISLHYFILYRLCSNYITMIAIPFNVYDAIVACGVNDADHFDGDTPAVRMATDLFGDDFATCMDKSFTELDGEFKTYSDLTQNQGQIRLLPGTKRNIRAFIQWTRDEPFG